MACLKDFHDKYFEITHEATDEKDINICQGKLEYNQYIIALCRMKYYLPYDADKIEDKIKQKIDRFLSNRCVVGTIYPPFMTVDTFPSPSSSSTFPVKNNDQVFVNRIGFDFAEITIEDQKRIIPLDRLISIKVE